MIVTLREIMQDGETFFIEHAVWQKDGTYKPTLEQVTWTPDILKVFKGVHLAEFTGGDVPEGAVIYLSRWMYPNNDSTYSIRIVVDRELNK